jgi:hypothetical protein
MLQSIPATLYHRGRSVYGIYINLGDILFRENCCFLHKARACLEGADRESSKGAIHIAENERDSDRSVRNVVEEYSISAVSLHRCCFVLSYKKRKPENELQII